MGVRISWLMLARNSLLVRFARSASSRADSSSAFALASVPRVESLLRWYSSVSAVVMVIRLDTLRIEASDSFCSTIQLRSW